MHDIDLWSWWPVSSASKGKQVKEYTSFIDPELEDPMAAKQSAGVGPSAVLAMKTKKESSNRSASLQPAASGVAKAKGAPEEVASFDPHLLLTKLPVGKTSQEYLADESVYSQGDAADAVFYVQSGKVKLTVVSPSGKEAVVAILAEKSFFGEGCLAGQSVRMATASVVERGTILRVKKQAMIALLHQNPEFAERFLGHLLARNTRM
jgi:CRP/FNR family transcriptional regulator, cyclic AMP receptor protein